MAIKDLDLNLEFEEEIEKKEALEVGDIQFSAGDDGPGNVTSIEKARPAVDKAAVNTRPRNNASQPGGSELQAQISFLEKQIKQLRSEVSEVKESAAAKVAVAEFKSEFLVEHLTAASVMDGQVNQVLNKIYKKVPALKNEILTIKKLVGDYNANLKKKK